MNITYKITKYPGLQNYYWVIMNNHHPIAAGNERKIQDCLDVMGDMLPGLTGGEIFRPHIEDTRWNKIQVLEIHSRDFE